MIRVIYKYALDIATGGQHAIPEGSTFLSVGVQGNTPVMWWSVPKDHDPAASKLRTFSIAVTGGPGYADNLFYVGSFQIDYPGGPFVGHVMSWEEIPREINFR
jgi:hypothetical protein